jgi:hypothetical protein
MASMVKLLLNFSLTVGLEGLHPLQGGILRLRHPSERRPGLAPEPAWVFWPRLAWDSARKTFTILSALARLTADSVSAARHPKRYRYMDQALTPVRDDDDATLDLMTKTGGARAAVAHIKRVDELTHAYLATPAAHQLAGLS